MMAPLLSRLIPQRTYFAWLHVFLVLFAVGSAFITASNQQSITSVTTGDSLRMPASGGGVVKRGDGGMVETTTRTAFGTNPPMSQHQAHAELEMKQVEVSDEKKGPLKVLFLSADTGGGHRASAEALAKQFQLHYPGSTYDLLDVWTLDGVYPYKTLVKSYKHLSAHPKQWWFFYHLSNTTPNVIGSTIHGTLMCERKIRKRIASYDADVVVSVHPTMNSVPFKSVKKISKAKGKHIPFFTVVTDFGSGHCMWFHRKVEKIYLASEKIRRLARRRGWTPDSKIVMSGLPIRHDFAVEADRLGDRTTPEGKAYQREVRRELGLDPEKHVVLVMGGGEGVGSLSDIVDELYASFSRQGIDATICVVCGRNEKLKKELSERDWEKVANGENKADRLSKRQRLYRMFHRRSHRSKQIQESLDKSLEDISPHDRGNVNVVGLGFVTNMAQYMVASDVLVSKAGPGTIAEAAAVGLPIMLTSFLPGQEAGNVDVVLEGGFGDYNSNEEGIAEEVACWLQDENLLNAMSAAAREVGHPHAAEDIVKDIGETTHAWMALNEKGKAS
jgi:1,2-diacylglycerol 3-beta-galactosyltransferase